MTLKNAQPRFGLMDDGRLMDYVKGSVVEATGTTQDSDGTWDLEKVAALIHAGKPIESALVSGDSQKNAKAQTVLDKVKAAWHDFEKHFESENQEHDKVAQAGRDFHATIEQHLAEVSDSPPPADDAHVAPGSSLFSDPSKLQGGTPAQDAAAEREARRKAAAAEGTGKAPFPNPGQPVEDLGAAGALTGGSIGGVTADTKGTPENTALQQNKAFTDSKKDSAIVDGHDIVKEKQVGSESSVMKEMGKEG